MLILFIFAVHEGEKNHVCHCGKAFFNKGVMKEHIKAGMYYVICLFIL